MFNLKLLNIYDSSYVPTNLKYLIEKFANVFDWADA